MRSRTKRIMEAVILITVFLLVFFNRYENHAREEFQLTEMDHYRTIIKSLRNKYGEGSSTPYQELFGQSRSYGNPGQDSEWNGINNLAGIEKLIGFQDGVYGVEEAPQWVHQYLDETEALSAKLENALQQGLCLPSPAELNDATKPVNIPNFLHVQNLSKALSQLAKRDWVRGDHNKAIDRAFQIIRLGDALKADPYLISHLIRLSSYQIGLDTLDYFTWLNPGKDENKKILEGLQYLKVEEWEIPEFVESPLVTAFSDGIYITQGFFSPETLGALLLFASSNPSIHKKTNEDIVAYLKELNLLPTNSNNVTTLAALTTKWTTVPAIKKRAKNIDPQFYENHTLLSSEDAKKIPVVFYLASRVLSNTFGYNNLNVTTRLEVAKAEAKNLLSAYSVRVSYDTNGRFTAIVDNQKHIMTLTDYTEPGEFNEPRSHEFISSSISSFFRSEDQVSSRINIIKNPSKPAHYHFSFSYDHALTIPNQLYNVIQPSNIEITNPELINWTYGSLQSFHPFIKSATPIDYMQLRKNYFGPSTGLTEEKYPAAIEIEMFFPKTSLWVVDPGPDGFYNGITLPYTPSNGLMSDGDIYQLVGWEN